MDVSVSFVIRPLRESGEMTRYPSNGKLEEAWEWQGRGKCVYLQDNEARSSNK
jgi:hypothetical protein